MAKFGKGFVNAATNPAFLGGMMDAYLLKVCLVLKKRYVRRKYLLSYTKQCVVRTLVR
jgi:hypothetical protein